MSDFLADQRAAIDRRLKELEAFVEEHRMLERAKEALADVGVGPSRRGPGRPRGSKSTRARKPAAAGGRQRRQRRGGTRAEHALKAVRQQPGITIPELAKKLRIKPNYLYRVMGELQSDGAVRKEGRGFHAK
jgi:hypothetical protein